MEDLSPEILLSRYEAAAGKAALIELQLRILAEIVPELEHIAHEYKLNDAEIIKWFTDNGDPVSADDENTIKVSRTFRNKILHGDFRKARDKMVQLGAEQRRGAGMLFTIATGAMQPVADTKTVQAGIGVWLMEFALTGDFEQAASIFAKTSALLETLISRANAIMVNRRPK